MSLKPILLGFLENPSSGYDLKKIFDETVRFFWSAELSQIYPTLHQLRSEGLVVSTRERSEKGPDREVYSRTPAGTEELQRWLAAGPVNHTERFAFLAQLFFLGQAEDLDLTRSFLQQLRARFADRLQVLRSIDDKEREEQPGYPESLTSRDFHAYLTLLCGLNRLEASVAWCDESLRLLEKRELLHHGGKKTTRDERGVLND
ncbi:MAG: PadR family transcriptional regulator [Acidobacteriota bacterium]|nr:PadR family transcriptional regulator [Acidobacteriota bacterium]